MIFNQSKCMFSIYMVSIKTIAVFLVVLGFSGSVVAHEEEGEAEHDVIVMDAGKLAESGIHVDAVSSVAIEKNISLFGVIAPAFGSKRDISARFPGVIKTLSVNVGDTVHKDQVLLTIESNESLQAYAVYSPLSGVVTSIKHYPGEHVGSDAVVTVMDTTQMMAELAAYPSDRALLKTGQKVRVIANEGKLDGVGSISSIAPSTSGDNQSIAVKVALENSAGHWYEGLFVTGDVAVATTQAAVAVPVVAVQSIENQTSVFVKEKNGFHLRSVKLGLSDQQHVEVLDGLRVGEQVATVNSFMLKSEMSKGEASHEH